MKITKTLKYDGYNFNVEGGILHVETVKDGITVSDALIPPAVSWDVTLEAIGGAGYVTLTVEGDAVDCVALLKKVEVMIDKLITKIEFTLDLVN